MVAVDALGAHGGAPPEPALVAFGLVDGVVARIDADPADVFAVDGEELPIDDGDRIIPITTNVCERWAMLNVPDPIPVIDALLAATALERDLVLVTRNTSDVERTGVAVASPFAPPDPVD